MGLIALFEVKEWMSVKTIIQIVAVSTIFSWEEMEARIFISVKKDRVRPSLHLYEGTEWFSYVLHAFFYIINNVNLVIEVGDIPLSKIIQNLSFHYTKFIKPVDLVKEHIAQLRQTDPDSVKLSG